MSFFNILARSKNGAITNVTYSRHPTDPAWQHFVYVQRDPVTLIEFSSKPIARFKLDSKRSSVSLVIELLNQARADVTLVPRPALFLPAKGRPSLCAELA